MKTLNVTVNDELVKKIKIYCIEKEISFKEFANKAILEHCIKLKIIPGSDAAYYEKDN